ncbi:MAG: type II CAAX prenyl endopeptidase Rce1 family protein [Sphingomonadaceae bacterium]
MAVRRQSKLLWTLVTIDSLLVLYCYLWFPPSQLTEIRVVPLPDIPIAGWQLGLANAVAILVVYGVAGKIGISIAGKLGLVGIYRKWAGWRAWFWDPLKTGLQVGLVFAAVDGAFALFHLGERLAQQPFPLWLFAAATASIGEEILFRMLVLGVWAMLLDLVLWRWVGGNAILGVANLAAALTFAAAGLPAMMALTGASTVGEIPVFTLVEMPALNVLLGLAAGGQYLKEGLVAAVGVHFWAAVVWQTLGSMV